MLELPRGRAVLSVLVLSWTGPALPIAQAQESQTVASAQAAGDDDQRTLAKRRFDRGREHFSARRYRDAIHAFELAYAMWPAPDLLFNIGRAYEELGDAASAVSYFERYLRDAINAPDAAEVRARVALLERRLEQAEAHREKGRRRGALRLVGTPPDARVWLDGSPNGPIAHGDSLFLPSGDHRLRVTEQDGSNLREAIVQVRPGETTTALFGEDAKAPLVDRRRGPSGLVLSGAVLSVACFAGTATIAAVAATHEGPTPRMSLGADVLLGTGLLTALVSTVVYFAEEPAE